MWNHCGSMSFSFGVNPPESPGPYGPGLSTWLLPPRERNGRRLAVQVSSPVLRPRLEPRYEPHEVLDRLLVGLAAFLRRRQLGVAQDAGLGITAGPRDDRR